MSQGMDAFLRGFIGYDENQIANLDIEWEPSGPPVLVYQAPNGAMRATPMTEDACHRCRDAFLADILELGP